MIYVVLWLRNVKLNGWILENNLYFCGWSNLYDMNYGGWSRRNYEFLCLKFDNYGFWDIARISYDY